MNYKKIFTMIKMYYVILQPFSFGKYYLHSGECPFLPEDGKKIFIGFFGSAEEAIEECRRMNIEVKECVFCSLDKKRRHYTTGAEKFVSSEIIKELPECALLCPVN